jgi:L-2-hydroxyglutarate oxidase LhgO
VTEIDCVVIGGGVVGLACAAEIASGSRSVCLLERHPRVGLETSTHNSGVVHAGIYYPTGSLKAKLCVRGRQML